MPFMELRPPISMEQGEGTYNSPYYNESSVSIL